MKQFQLRFGVYFFKFHDVSLDFKNSELRNGAEILLNKKQKVWKPIRRADLLFLMWPSGPFCTVANFIAGAYPLAS
jgi:hypothetical protein